MRAYYDAQSVHLDGSDELGRKIPSFMETRSASSEDRLSPGLRVSLRNNFVELIEQLLRCGLMNNKHQWQQLTAKGSRYLTEPRDLQKGI
jgi:hypothetical protein